MYKFNFASCLEAQVTLGNTDEYIMKMSDYEKKLKLGHNNHYKIDNYLEFLESCALEWNEAEMKKITIAFNQINKKIMQMKTFLDVTITLIKTNGADEWNSAYTRGTCIILPEKKLSYYEGERLERLIAHELFHVISRNNTTLRKCLYEAINYWEAYGIIIPEDILAKKLTNPDAIYDNYYTKIEFENKEYFALPIVMLGDNNSSIDNTKDILSSISIKFLLLDVNMRAVKRDGLPVCLDFGQAKEIYSKIGMELDHLEQPEEIMAEYFTSIVMGDCGIDSPIVKKIINILY